MNVVRTRMSRLSLAVAIALSAGLLAGITLASHYPGHISFRGGGQVSTYVVTDEDGWPSSSNNVWEDVTGARVELDVPSGRVRLVTARYNAESSCGASNWCAVRIVARKQGSPTKIEFRPRVDNDFAFDAPGGEAYEGNSVNRSIRLGAGHWFITVQAQVVGGSGDMYLDDWHFEVQVNTAS